MQHSNSKTYPLYKRRWFMAACALIILFVAGLLLIIPQKFSAPKGSIFELTLPDGTKAILYNGAAISYNSRNWDRELKLEGEAYFKVPQGKAFTINTPQGSVKVLGTKLKVKSAHKYFEICCYEGKVNVIYKRREFILASMQQITFTGDIDTGVQDVKESHPLWLSQ